VILFLHNRYRTTGGEERAVDDLRGLAEERLGERTEVLARDSATLGARRAATGLLRGGLDEHDVAEAVRRTGARVVHAHNLLPAFGWRALAAAREAGARTVLHLHNYRLVCAVGVCFTHDGECTRCHGRNTFPGVRLNCRGTGPEAAVYGASLALHQRRMLAHADAVVVPSAFAAERLRAMGVPLPADTHVVPHVVGEIAAAPAFTRDGPALVASRLAREKGVDLAIDACRAAGVPLVIAGDGPLREELEAYARDDRGRPLSHPRTFTELPSELSAGDVVFAGRVDDAELARLRASASVAVVPSRTGETFGLAAAEAMAAGLPVAATRNGALAELVPEEQLAKPGDVRALAQVVRSTRADARAAQRGLDRVREVSAPDVVAPLLAAVYAG
jgi:glycosyltransferase involved in cell wall biosynthesis